MAIDREKVLQAAQKFVEKKKYDKAVLEYQKIIQEDPNDARTLLKIGDLQLKMEAYAEAISTYERVGRFYAAQGFSLKAIAVYKQIREIIHKHVPQLVDRYAHIPPKLAELYQQLGLISDALAALDEVASRLQQQNRDTEALDVYRKIVALDPSNPLPHLRLAEALSRAKDNDGAAGEFSLAASQLVKAGRRDDALKVIERLLHHRPDPAQARIAAELYLARNQPKDGMQALAKLQVCFQANPKDLDTLALLARAFQAIGQANKALEVHKEMARIAKDAGKTDLFREILQRLQTIAPNDEGVRALAKEGVVSTPAPPPAAQAARVETPAPPPAPPVPPPQPQRKAPPLPPQRRVMESEPEEISSLEEIPPSLVPPPPVAEHTQSNDEGGGVELVDGGEGQLSAEEQLATLIEEAATARENGELEACAAALRGVLEIDPRHVDAHTALRDVLMESGDTAGAVEQMLELASIQLEDLDGDGAARSLQEALAIDPRNERAIQTLQELGYDVPPPPMDASGPAEGAPALGDATNPDYASTDHEAPLPAYELEELGPASMPPRGLTGPSEPPPIPRRAIDAIDDPFGEGGGRPEPLPSYPTDDPESDPAFALVRASQPPPGNVPSLDTPDDPREYTRPVPRDEIESQIANTRPTAELEEALEEAEFFASRGLYEDARAVLNDQLARLPNHPLLHERMEELEAQERGAAQASGTRSVPHNTGEDRSFDIAASLDALESLDDAAPMPAEGNALVDGQIDVEEVFAKFKEGVQKQISQDDGQAHYDLGLAYKEMALVDDAIREFEVASHDRNLTCICESMIGMMHLEHGHVNEAIDAFLRGLHAPVRTSDQETMLWFELGGAYESKNMFKDALAYYQRVARREPNYRDIQERVRRLSHYASMPPVRQAAVGADDEFDRAFDEIIGSGKLP